MEGLVQSIDSLANQYWMLWATVIVAGFAIWNIWTGKHRQWRAKGHTSRLQGWPKLNFTAAQFNS